MNEAIEVIDKLIDRSKRYLKDAIEREDQDDSIRHTGEILILTEAKEIIMSKGMRFGSGHPYN